MITKTVDLGSIRLMPRWKADEKMLFTNINLRSGIFDLMGSGRFSDGRESMYSASLGIRFGRTLQLRAYAMGKASEKWIPNFSAMFRAGAFYIRASVFPMSDRGNVTAQIRFLKRNHIMVNGFFVKGQDPRFTVSMAINLPLRFTVKVPERLVIEPAKEIIFK